MDNITKDIMTSAEDKEKLKVYATELGLTNPEYLTLETLIESHRFLRNAIKPYNEDIAKARKEAWDYAYKIAYENAVECDYLSREQLQKLTVKELGEYLEGE